MFKLSFDRSDTEIDFIQKMTFVHMDCLLVDMYLFV